MNHYSLSFQYYPYSQIIVHQLAGDRCLSLPPSTISQFHNHAQSLKVKTSGGPLDNQTWQTEWKTTPLTKVQLCEHENQTLEAYMLLQTCCMQNVIVQWPARICYFYLLRMIGNCFIICFSRWQFVSNH